ncbi:YtxH domain-containing protein [Spirosoma arcticum]
MKNLLTTTTLLTMLSVAALAQNERPRDRPLIKEETKEKVRDKAQDVKENVQEGAEKLRERAEERAPEVKQELRETGQQVKDAAQDVKVEVQDRIVEPARARNDRYGLPWYDRGSVFVGGSLGFGLGGSKGTYIALDPRIGYFFQPGFMGGVRLGYDRRLGSSFRSRQFGLFARYYPFRTRISSFVGAGYNFGRERASNVAADEKARFNSINLEIGTQFYLLKNLGIEGSLETNYYDRSNPLAGRNRGGRIRLGVNYYLRKVGR